jgi:soluble lytic murein transglycosylase-like protein
MPGEAPIYVSGEAPPALARVGLEPTAIPQLQNNLGEMAAQLGQAGEAFGNSLFQAKQATNHILANAEYLTGVDRLRDKYANDPDWQNAPKNFAAEAKQLQSDVLEKYPLVGHAQAMTQLYMDRYTISANRHVETEAHARGFQATRSGDEQNAVPNANAATSALTQVDRQDAIDRQTQIIMNAHAGGWYSDEYTAKRLNEFQSMVDKGDWYRDLRADPKGAFAKLQDPKNYPTFTPAERQSSLLHATEAADAQGREAAIGTFNGAPYAASLIAGQFASSDHIDQLFDKQIIKQESGGQNLAPNTAGAFGPAQITPAFARDYAGKLPPGMQAQLGDISNLSDKELTDKLMTMPLVSTAIGQAGFEALAAKYDNPVLAMAAYNAGPANADRWQAAAQKQFGPNPSPDQVASVIDLPETQKYVASVYGRAGARMDRYGVSPGGVWQLGTSLGVHLTQEQERQDHLENEIARVEVSTHPLAKMLQEGSDVSGDQIAQQRAILQRGAATGNVESIKQLRDLDYGEKVQPIIQQAGRMPFNVLDQLVNVGQAKMQAEGAGADPDEARTIGLLAKKRDAINEARFKNPTGLVVDAKIDNYVPIDTTASPTDPKWQAAVLARGAQADFAQKEWQGKAIAFSPDEIKSLNERYLQAGANDQFALLKSLADALSPAAYKDTVKGIAGNAPGAELMGEFARTRPELAREMLTGAQILKGEKDTPDKASAVKAVLADKLGGQIYPSDEQQQSLVQGALALDAARRASGGGLYAGDAAGLGQAIDDIAGTSIKRNGVQVRLPPTMPASQATDLINHLDDKGLELFGGAMDRNGRPISAADINAHGKWLTREVGGSTYAIDMPGAGGDFPVHDFKGNSLTIDLARLAAARSAQAKAAAPSDVLQHAFRATIAGMK